MQVDLRGVESYVYLSIWVRKVQDEAFRADRPTSLTGRRTIMEDLNNHIYSRGGYVGVQCHIRKIGHEILQDGGLHLSLEGKVPSGFLDR